MFTEFISAAWRWRWSERPKRNPEICAQLEHNERALRGGRKKVAASNWRFVRRTGGEQLRPRVLGEAVVVAADNPLAARCEVRIVSEHGFLCDSGAERSGNRRRGRAQIGET